MPRLLLLLATTLALTCAIELGLAALLFGVRTQREALVVVLAQVVTNPLVELLCLAVGWQASLPVASGAWLLVLAAEVAAALVEGKLYRMAQVSQHPWRMSAVLNGCSFGLGLVLAAAGLL